MNHDTQCHQEQLLRHAQDLEELMECNDRLEQSFKKVQTPGTIPTAPLRNQRVSLGSQIFAVDQLVVLEPIQHPLLAAVPLMPALRGVKNGRGQVVSLIDLQLRTCPASAPAWGLASVLIFEAQRESLRVELGLMSYSVGAIAEIEPLPQAGAWIKRGFMRGMATVNDESLIIREPSHALTRDDMAIFADHAERDPNA